jgi:hypothetical protein
VQLATQMKAQNKHANTAHAPTKEPSTEQQRKTNIRCQSEGRTKEITSSADQRSTDDLVQ